MPRVDYTISTARARPIVLSPRLRRIGRVGQVLAGGLLLAVGFAISGNHGALLYSGARASGRIVDLKSVRLQTGSSSTFWTTAHIPIVEYRIADRTIRFEDWLGGRPSEHVGATVPVLYDPTQPAVAMIDRPVWNWIPWGPTAAVGLLVLASGVIGLIRLQRESPE